MDAIEIGKRIKQRREELHLTQEDLGAPLGFNKSTIQRYETGKIRKIKLPVLESMAKILKVEPNWLALKTNKPTLTLGEKISKRRKELGISIDDIALKIGKDKATVYRYENNEMENIPIGILIPLAEALFISTDYFIDSAIPQTTLPRQTGEHLFLTPTQEKILSNCQQLNETGQKKVLDFSDDLVSTEKYKPIGREPGYKIAALGGRATQGDDQPPIEEKIIR